MGWHLMVYKIKNEYRLRVGNYRIIYEQNLNEFIILITKAENRGQIYKSI